MRDAIEDLSLVYGFNPVFQEVGAQIKRKEKRKASVAIFFYTFFDHVVVFS